MQSTEYKITKHNSWWQAYRFVYRIFTLGEFTNSKYHKSNTSLLVFIALTVVLNMNLSNPTGHYMYRQFNIQNLYALTTLNLHILCGSENKWSLFPHTSTDWFL